MMERSICMEGGREGGREGAETPKGCMYVSWSKRVRCTYVHVRRQKGTLG